MAHPTQTTGACGCPETDRSLTDGVLVDGHRPACQLSQPRQYVWLGQDGRMYTGTLTDYMCHWAPDSPPQLRTWTEVYTVRVEHLRDPEGLPLTRLVVGNESVTAII